MGVNPVRGVGDDRNIELKRPNFGDTPNPGLFLERGHPEHAKYTTISKHWHMPFIVIIF